MENKENNKKHITLNRRMFLKLSLWASGLASAWGLLRFFSYEPPTETLEPNITLGAPNTYQLGTKLYIPEVKAWLMRDKDGLYAVSATCTHLGCTVNNGDEKFICPCHDSQFDHSGRVLQGPASDPLPHFELSLSDDGRVIINRLVTVPPIIKLKPSG